MHQPDNTRWHLCDPGGLAIRTWPDDDIAIVYAGQQRTTHLLDALSTELLKGLLVAGPSRAIDLIHWLEPGSRRDAAVDLEFADAVAVSLKCLERADLVTCRPC